MIPSLTRRISLNKLQPDLFIEPNAPEPKVVTSERDLFLLYFYDKSFASHGADLTTGIAVIRFSFPWISKFGGPNDEALPGHRYYSLGLSVPHGFEVFGSEWIKELEKANRVHSRHDPSRFMMLRHFIIGFKDSVFECIARDFSLAFYPNKSFKEIMAIIVSQF